MTQEESLKLVVPASVHMTSILGPEDAILRFLNTKFTAQACARGNVITIQGDAHESQILEGVFSELIAYVQAGFNPNVAYVERVLALLHTGDFAPKELRDDVVHTYKGRVIRPKTAGQKQYVDAMRSHTITFGLGPAGTGKTYLAVALGLSLLQKKEVGRLVLSRPVVEAGESLGFLPGSLEEKIDPYIRPLYDALYTMADPEKINRMIEDGVIEIIPLAFMRGRTLNDAFVILDEAQNTTPEQMKMFLTRLGFNARMVITGDGSQIDLPGKTSGLHQVEDILAHLEDISFCRLSGHDVVRHNLVAQIVEAYAQAEEA